MIHDRRNTVLVGVAALLACPCLGLAEIITFQNQSISVLLKAGPQTENPFTYQAVSGAWEVQPFFGNPVSALATWFTADSPGDVPHVGDTLDITIAGPYPRFIFNSVDFATMGHDSSDISITGFRGGAPVGTLAITSFTPSQFAFQTVASTFSGEVDVLRVILTYEGVSAMLLDNFDLAPIPEPVSLGLVALGAALLLAGRRHA